MYPISPGISFDEPVNVVFTALTSQTKMVSIIRAVRMRTGSYGHSRSRYETHMSVCGDVHRGNPTPVVPLKSRQYKAAIHVFQISKCGTHDENTLIGIDIYNLQQSSHQA